MGGVWLWGIGQGEGDGRGLQGSGSGRKTSRTLICWVLFSLLLLLLFGEYAVDIIHLRVPNVEYTISSIRSVCIFFTPLLPSTLALSPPPSLNSNDSSPPHFAPLYRCE